MQRRALKARILDHAELRLLEQGYRGMRVDELARDVGISKRTLYEQFRTKEEMAREALGRIVEDLQASLDQAISEHRDDEPAQLRAIAHLLCQRFAKARQPFYRDLETTPSLIELIEQSRTETFRKIETVLRAGIGRGRFRPELDTRLVRMTMLAAVDEILQPPILLQEGLTVEQACHSILDLLVHGILVREPGTFNEVIVRDAVCARVEPSVDAVVESEAAAAAGPPERGSVGGSIDDEETDVDEPVN